MFTGLSGTRVGGFMHLQKCNQLLNPSRRKQRFLHYQNPSAGASAIGYTKANLLYIFWSYKNLVS